MEKKDINEIKINEMNSEKESEKKNNNNRIINNEILRKNQKSYSVIPKSDIKINNKYDNALLEELYNSKDKSWRMELANNENITNNLKRNISHKELLFDKEKILNSKEENDNEKDAKTIENNKSEKELFGIKNDRFKDFDDILYSEETKDKKRKNRSAQKLVTYDNFKPIPIAIPKPLEKKNSMDANDQIKNNIKNLFIIEEVLEKEDKNKNLFIKQNNEGNKMNLINDNYNVKNLNEINDNNHVLDIINDNNENKENKENNLINNDETRYNHLNDFNNHLDQNINNTNDNIINKYSSINLEYSEDKKTDDEKEEKKIEIINLKNNNNIKNNNSNHTINFYSNNNIKSNNTNKIETKTKKNNNGNCDFNIDNIINKEKRVKFNSDKNNNIKMTSNEVKKPIYINMQNDI